MKKLVFLISAVTLLGSSQAISQTPSYKTIPNKNVVVQSIQKKLPKLRLPDKSFTQTAKIEVEASIPADAVSSIEAQHTFMMQAFPEAFRWGSNTFFVYTTRKGAREKAIKESCRFGDEFQDTNNEPQGMNAITFPCGDNAGPMSTISFLNWPSFQKYDPVQKRTPDGTDMWSFLAAQEGDGSLIQSFYYKGRDENPNGNPMPAWYEQGGQFALSSVALAVAKRQWRQSSLQQGSVNVCQGASLKTTFFYNSPENQRSCHYQLGAIATELMVALYGFDAPIKWLQYASIPYNATNTEKMAIWNSSFRNAFGDSLTTFIQWSDSYARYLATNGKSALPKNLLARL